MVISLLFLCLLARGASAQSPSTAGFISIDCGLESKVAYKDKNNGLMFSPDEPYTSAGVNKEVSSETNVTGLMTYYANVRSFPEGVRNCYTLAPVVAGAKYKVKAEFLYGNYDGLRRPPTFDLYLDVNLWTTVEVGNFSRMEIVALAVSESMEVCLVNTGQGRPFISELDLRPIPFSMYSQVNSQQSLVLSGVRYNFGGENQIKYPDDAYDRFWMPWTPGTGISTASTVSQPIGNEFPVPSDVLKTAVAASSSSDSLNFTVDGSSEQKSYVYIYVAELQKLETNETREFNIYAGERMFIDHYRPVYLEGVVIYTKPPGLSGGLTYYVRPTLNSTLPPLINALEAFNVQELSFLTTDQTEVKAISELKKSYGVSRNWQGDPCLPKDFVWEGLECSLNASSYSRITSLDLSRSGLSGGIPPSIANLTQLTSLDLSYNNFTGEIPLYFDQRPMLKLLNLEGNNLNGTISDTLYERSQSGSLVLRIDKNPILCGSVNLCTSTEKKKNIILPVAVAVSASVLVLFAVVITVCLLKRRRMKKNQNDTPVELHSKERGTGTSPFLPNGNRMANTSGMGSDKLSPLGFVSESHLFSSSDIASITENFKRPIGRGGFGVVYHGYLKDGTQVAVKVLSLLSAQGEKQFRAEAQLLTRVHHKYLVSLLGYCNDNLALVYEFVPLGSLADHLSGDAGAGNMLSWSRRVRIALEAAQGLDYLHSGCKPPIVHRDVKTSNILLNENFEVKLADFGLSRSFNKEDLTHISTVVAGTPGYLDPEYYQTNRLSESSDVYSFGIVLLELITGKPPIGNDAKRTHITQEVKARLERGDIAEIVDGRLQGHYDVSSVWKIVEIALSCTSRNSEERPTIGDVVVQLKDCQASEPSREFLSEASTDLLAMIPPYSMTNITPSAR